MSKKQLSKSQMSLFDNVAHETGGDTLTRRQIEEQIIRKETELLHGQQDYNRHRPSMRALEIAAATKNSNRAKVDGVWMDVRFCKYLVKFMKDWTRRRSQLAWEIDELKKLIA